MCISDYIQTTFFYPGRFFKKLADDQCSSITKGSMYISDYIQTTFFYLERCLKKLADDQYSSKVVSTISNIMIYNLLPFK